MFWVGVRAVVLMMEGGDNGIALCGISRFLVDVVGINNLCGHQNGSLKVLV